MIFLKKLKTEEKKLLGKIIDPYTLLVFIKEKKRNQSFNYV